LPFEFAKPVSKWSGFAALLRFEIGTSQINDTPSREEKANAHHFQGHENNFLNELRSKNSFLFGPFQWKPIALKIQLRGAAKPK